MDKKVSVGIVAVIVVVVAITAGILGVKFGSKRNVATAPVTIVQKPAAQVAPVQTPAPAPQQTAEIVYTNSDFSFQITLPKGWENYKAIVSDKDKSVSGVTYVYIDLPTTNKAWAGDMDPVTGKSLMGYASMFAINVWNIDSFNKHLASCAKESDPSCAGKDALLAKGKTYAYEIVGPQAMPEDLQPIVNNGSYIKAIKDSFKVIAGN